MSLFSGITAFGDHLIVGHANGLSMLYTPDGERGAWVSGDLVSNPSSFGTEDGVLYFVGASGASPFDFGVMRFAPRANTQRGHYTTGEDAPVRAVSRTLGSEDDHTKIPWHRVGARVASPDGSGTATVKLTTGSFQTPGVEGPEESDASLDGLDSLVAGSPGPAREVHVDVDATHDVRIESATVWWRGEAPER